MHSLRVVWVFPLIVCLAALAGCSRDRTGGGLGINPRSFIDAGSATCTEACTNLRRLAEHPSCAELGFELPPDCEGACADEMPDGATLACIANAADCGQFLMCVEGGTECSCDSSSACEEGCSCDLDCDVPPPPLDAGTGTDAGPGCECDITTGSCDADCACDLECGGILCTEECAFTNDGECDDGGEGSTTSACELGTDCIDCGPRTAG